MSALSVYSDARCAMHAFYPNKNNEQLSVPFIFDFDLSHFVSHSPHIRLSFGSSGERE